MPAYRNHTVVEMARGLRAFLSLGVGITRGEVPDLRALEIKLDAQSEKLARAQQRVDQQNRQLHEQSRQLQEQNRQIQELRQAAEAKNKKTTGAQEERWLPSVKLRELGNLPRTIVDVGAAKGTPQLYECFPDSFQVLVDPVQEYRPYLEEILTRYEGKYILTALGARDEKVVMNVDPKRPSMSSVYERTDLTSTRLPPEKREIPVTTLDTLMKAHDLQPPFGLKIDTEGFELQVIEGASEFLRETEFVIAELSVAERFVGSYLFAEFTEAMNRNDFYLWDILYIGGKKFVDAVFKKRRSVHV
jgi:FkbM family methyltransferase